MNKKILIWSLFIIVPLLSACSQQQTWTVEKNNSQASSNNPINNKQLETWKLHEVNQDNIVSTNSLTKKKDNNLYKNKSISKKKEVVSSAEVVSNNTANDNTSKKTDSELSKESKKITSKESKLINKQTINTQNNNFSKENKLSKLDLQEEKQSKLINKENNNSEDSNSKESKKVIKEMRQINESSQKPWFTKINCKENYTTTWAIELCEEKQLWFAKLFCYTDEINKPINEIINKGRFNLIDTKKLEKTIQYCKQQRELVKKSQEQQKERENEIKNFKLSDCSSYIKQKYPNLNNQLEIQKLIKQCKIWYAINYAKNCNILTNTKFKKECIIIQKYITQYKLMQKYSHDYGDFRLDF